MKTIWKFPLAIIDEQPIFISRVVEISTGSYLP